MRKLWLVLFAGLTVSVFTGNASAQQEVLDSLIDLALKNNPELSSAAHVRQSKSNDASAAGALPDPLLSISVMNLPVNSFSLDRTPMSGVSAGLTQKIPWPGKLSARADLADAQFRKSEATVKAIENQVVREVTNAFLEYSFWSRTRVIIEEYLELLTATREVAEARYANGNAPAQDVLRVSSMLSRTDVRLLKADQRRYSSLLKLRQAVGDSSIFEELPAYLPEPLGNDSIRGSIETNPLLTDAALDVERAQIQRRLTQREYWPDLILGVDYRFRKEVPGDPVRGTDYLTFKLGVNLPLWFFLKQKHRVQSAEQLALASQERERSVRDILTMRYRDAQSNLLVALESIHRYDESILPEAEAAVEAAEVAYEVGKVDFNSLLTAQSDAFEIRLEHLDLVRQYHQTRAALAELSGISYER